MIGLVAVTAAGRRGADRLAGAWPGRTRAFDPPAGRALPRAFAECEAVVAFLPTGATVRLLAPHLRGKQADPGVVCVDEAWRYAVALLGGHAGGADALARGVGSALGAEPVVTTGSAAAGVPALDELAGVMGWGVEPGSDLAGAGSAVLSGHPVHLVGERTHPLPALPGNVAPRREPEAGVPALVISDRAGSPGEPAGGTAGRVVYRPRSLAVGVGASRGVAAAEIVDLVRDALDEGGLSPLSVRHLATIDVKAREPGVVEAATALGVSLVTYPAGVLARVEVPHPSDVVEAEVGTPSVAEAAARCAGPAPDGGGPAGAAAGPGELVVPKRRSANATVAVARHAPRGRLALVGLGPGARDLLAPRAERELRRAGVVVGLDRYVDRVRDLLRPGTRVLPSGLGDERHRAHAAVAEAAAGHAVALLGSGDAGVYAMASPALAAADESVEVVAVPGVTAATAASGLLGAPLGHDHAALSLSDLHTPWEVIERRVRAVAEGDLAVTFYNPRSSDRDWQLPAALAILAEHRPPGTPVGVVRNASRPAQRVTLGTLGGVGGVSDVDVAAVDMSSVVVVGATSTRVVAGRMVTPRGYRWGT